MKVINSKIHVLALLIAAFVCLPFQSRAAYRAFLAITGVTGPGANGTIPILSYSLGVSSYNGNASFSDVSAMKSLDLTSPLLAFQCAKGITNATAVLTVVNSTTGNALYTVTLSNAAISSYQVSGSTGVPTESVSLYYNAIVWTYQAQDGSGNNVGSPVTHNWNLVSKSGS